MNYTTFKQLEKIFWNALSIKSYHEPHIQAYLSSVTAVAGFNLLYVENGASLSALENALNWYRSQKRDATIVCEKGAASKLLNDHQESLQLSPEDPTTAMMLDLTTWQPLTNRVNDFLINEIKAPLDDWAKPLSTAFSDGETALTDFDLEITAQYQKAHEEALTNHAPIHHFVIRVAGIPVCNLSLTLTKEGARFDDIGTDIHEQGKGYATTLIQHALLFAKEKGATIAALESSTAGLSIYQKLGFKALFEYEAFAWEYHD
ncbi:GNAT family N-acetyltransferase [Ignatzschineria rhizosphaerae]|uniref:GNAT family N-acetyltransferase n=1 Tax=Ignatzschineria rhizosphaerae TaxID=2923279 RepID=A0ABY3WZW9_9GAMM|nr:GNAT family N-acetyltransferase [Ignatzschineria rhizosphaerae]UNM95585.1 GNAT family N-acetyltransferase [Ignatzschineria rhizosphaerae]